MSEHSRFSPSGAKRWMSCAGSLAMEEGEPDVESQDAANGTFAHWIAQECLTKALAATEYLGTWDFHDKEILVDNEYAAHVQTYVNEITERARGRTLLVEQRVEFSKWVNTPNQTGTADAVILDDDEIEINDLKFGMRKVFAEKNEQMMIYALGAIYEYALTGAFKRVRLVIHQPRLAWVSEWSLSVEELLEFGERLELHAEACKVAFKLPLENLNDEGALTPGSHCDYCKASSKCPALRDHVFTMTSKDFEPIPPEVTAPTGRLADLAFAMTQIPVIEKWCKNIRAAVEREVFAGNKLPGFKLVQGKKGNRAWTSEDAVIAEMKAMRMREDEMYSFKPISPTQAEKLLKATPRRWKRLLALVTQAAGLPSVAPEDDPRPGIDALVNDSDFENIETKKENINEN